jgi:RNA polymerase sigma factor (sigma-70 family)
MASSASETSRLATGDRAEQEDMTELPDDHLLDRFFGPDEAKANAAFELLVQRHGPMVMGVCRHILQKIHDAEDAFQATFLVLARKAHTIHDRRVLARWLYEVAYRIAIRSKAHSARRLAHERQGAEMAADAPRLEQDPGWVELRPVLHEEVNRLPEKYRTAVVLCYLEGRTNEEAAELLKWPVGTVKGRLSRAREILRSRLARRGLGTSAAFLMTSLSRDAAFADVVPSRLIDDTTRIAMLAIRNGEPGLGGGSISDRVASLAENAILPARRAFFWLSLPRMTIGVVLVAMLLYLLNSGLVRGDWRSTRPLTDWFSLKIQGTVAPGACH